MQPIDNLANTGVNPPETSPAVPSHEQLVTTATRVLTEMAENERGKKPSLDAIVILAKMMANRTLREIKEGKANWPPAKKD